MKERKLTYLFDGLPLDFFDYVYDLDITVTPDYEYWQSLFLETAGNQKNTFGKHHKEVLTITDIELSNRSGEKQF